MSGLISVGEGANIRHKKTERMARFFYEIGAQEKTRTSTTVRSLAPEASVSTNFTTIWPHIYYPICCFYNI